jgi:pimeloyl-ACP methyl ester carboxylesterase
MNDPFATEERATVLGRPAVFLRRRAADPSPTGPHFVLLHGAGGNHRSFDELVAALDREDVIVPALPGRSGTEGPPPATAAEAAAFVRALLAALGVERFVLMGHSYGGGIAMEVALAAAMGEPPNPPPHARAGVASPPPSVEGILLVATGARLRVHPSILERARAAAAGEGPPVDLRAVFQPETDPALVARFEARTASVPASSTLADWIATNAFDRLGALGALRAPMVALAGDRDALTPPRYAQHFADQVPGARVQTVAGGGHMLPVERPEAVVAALRAFSAAGAPPHADPVR